MKVTVLGATGPTGLEIVSQALAKSWEVTAIVRNPSKLPMTSALLHVVVGNVLDAATIRDDTRDADALVSALGAPGGIGKKGRTTLYSAAARTIVEGLSGRERIKVVFCSSAGVEEHDPSERWFYRYVAKPYFLQHAYDDMKEAESILRSSPLSWVLVRPGRLINGPGGHLIRVNEHFRPPGGMNITRADLAQFMLMQVESDEWIGRTPTLTE